MPTWVTPNVLTAAGLAGALAVFAGYAASAVDREDWLLLAIVGYVLHWFKSMDGSLAHYRQMNARRWISLTTAAMASRHS